MGRLVETAINELTEKEIEIIDSMCKCNLNKTKVSEDLYTCRTNVIYHLEKIKEKTGLDPNSFYDLVELKKLLNHDKQTNADRIRSMSDEELAEVIMCPHDSDGSCRDVNSGKSCIQCSLEWLQSETEG